MKELGMAEDVQAFDRDVTRALDLVNGSEDWLERKPHFLNKASPWKIVNEARYYKPDPARGFAKRLFIDLTYQSDDGRIVKSCKSYHA